MITRDVSTVSSQMPLNIQWIKATIKEIRTKCQSSRAPAAIFKTEESLNFRLCTDGSSRGIKSRIKWRRGQKSTRRCEFSARELQSRTLTVDFVLLFYFPLLTLGPPLLAQISSFSRSFQQKLAPP